MISHILRMVAPDIESSNHKQPTMDDVPAWGLGRGITTPDLQKITCYQMLRRDFNLLRFSGMTYEMENRYNIWNLECQETLQVRFIENSSKKISKA